VYNIIAISFGKGLLTNSISKSYLLISCACFEVWVALGLLSLTNAIT